MQVIVSRLDGVDLSRTPSFYLTHLDGGVESDTSACEDSCARKEKLLYKLEKSK